MLVYFLVSGVTPASDVRLEDFTLTRMDRPHHIYSTDGQLIVKMPDNNQSGYHNNAPLGKSPNVMRSYVLSNGHYALPIIDSEPYDSNLRKAVSTEKLVTKHIMTSELPGIDNPSFSCDEILDSGNESDRISDAKQETPEVSPTRMISPAATSTPGAVPHDTIDGAVTPGTQTDNEISETSVDVTKVNESSLHDSSGDSACPLMTAESGTANVNVGSITGVGALGFSVEEQNAMMADLPPPPDFDAPPVPPPPPALPTSSHVGSDSASDSGAASARQSDIDSPSSSELGGTHSK